MSREMEGLPSAVVVPDHPAPLVHLDTAAPRQRDELDQFIDDLFPDVEGGPGWFDATLVGGGVALLGWGAVLGGPGAATVVGAIALGLGAILPARWLWRRLLRGRHQRRRVELLAGGLLLDTSTAATTALVAAYERLLATVASAPELATAATAAAHDAVREAASVLAGRPPADGPQIAYVEARVRAIERLAGELAAARRPETPVEDDRPGADPAALLAARAELDELSPLGAMARIAALTEEAKTQHRDLP